MSIVQMRPLVYERGLNDLIDFIDKTKPTSNLTMIEIGSYAGESTEIFAKRFGKVITIDPHVSGYDSGDSAAKSDFNEVVKMFTERKSKFQNIDYMRMKSDDAINELMGTEVDFVYIDGWHVYEQVKKDIQNYLPLIKKGGFIGGHDFHPGWQGVVNAIIECLGSIDGHFNDTSWIKRI